MIPRRDLPAVILGRVLCHLGYHAHEEWTRVVTPDGQTWVSECARPGCMGRDYMKKEGR